MEPTRKLWIDPNTGTPYDADTMAVLSTAGENLGELPSHRSDAPALTDEQADTFAAMLGITD